jgi:hypothetical protein
MPKVQTDARDNYINDAMRYISGVMFTNIVNVRIVIMVSSVRYDNLLAKTFGKKGLCRSSIKKDLLSSQLEH